MSFVIFDTEYTSWQGCQEKGWIGNQKKEIVQISALKVSEDLEVIAEFNELCKPVINPHLSDYFVNLTHITDAQIEKYGKSFNDAYRDFAAFVDTDRCYSHSWGADFVNKSDGEIIEENLTLYRITGEKRLEYRNLAALFKQLYTTHNISVLQQSSGQIATILGLEQDLESLGLNPHNALYDVYSIRAGLKYFYPESVKLLQTMEKNIEDDKKY